MKIKIFSPAYQREAAHPIPPKESPPTSQASFLLPLQKPKAKGGEGQNSPTPILDFILFYFSISLSISLTLSLSLSLYLSLYLSLSLYLDYYIFIIIIIIG